MAPKNDNIIKFRIQTEGGREAVVTFDRTQKGLRGVAEEVAEGQREARDATQRFGDLGLAMDGVRQSAELIQQTFGRALDAYQAQESASRRLEATSKLTGASLDQMRAQSGEAAETLRLSARQADELTIGLTKLTARAGETERTGEAMKELLDVAAAQGYDAQQALEAINQALMGQDEGTDKLFQKNPSAIYEGWAKAAGMSASTMDEAQKAQALLNEIMETGEKVGNSYADFLRSGAGRQQVFNAQLEDAQAELGALVSDALGPMLYAGTEVLELFNALPDGMQRVIGTTGALFAVIQALRVSGLVPTSASLMAFGAKIKAIPAQAAAASAGLTGLRAGFAAVGGAAKGFYASLGPLGWFTLAIGIAAEAWAYLGAETQEAADATESYRDQVENLSLIDLKAELDVVTEKLQTYRGALEDAADFAGTIAVDTDGGTRLYSRSTLEADAQALRERRDMLQTEVEAEEEAAARRREIREEEQRDEKQTEQAQKLRVEALREGIEREKAELENWYAEQKALAEGSKENLLLVEEVYGKRLAQLQRKRQEGAREREFTLRELEIEAMEDGHAKKLAEIDLQVDEEIEKYRQEYARRYPDLFEEVKQLLEKQRQQLRRDLLPETPEVPIFEPVVPDLDFEEIDFSEQLLPDPPRGFGDAWQATLDDKIEPALRRTREAIDATRQEIDRLEAAGEDTQLLQGTLADLERAEAALMAFQGATDIAIDAISSSFAVLGESLGESIAGIADETKSVKDKLLLVLADAASAIGDLLISIGTPMLLAGVTAGTGAAYIAAGMALKAIGSGISGAVNKEDDSVQGEQRRERPEVRGYAKGTDHAARGVALLGEKGPELVEFRGGERVLTNQNTEALMRMAAQGVRGAAHARKGGRGGGAASPAQARRMNHVLGGLEDMLGRLAEDGIEVGGRVEADTGALYVQLEKEGEMRRKTLGGAS